MQVVIKQRSSLERVSRVLVLVLAALLLLIPGIAGFVLLFFVPLVGWFLWRDQDRITQLEKKLAVLEKPAVPEPPKSEEA